MKITSESYIKIKDALNCLTGQIELYPSDMPAMKAYLTEVNEKINALPTVRIEAGQWGEHGECPFCGYIQQWEDDNFCGHCGARLTVKGE